MRNTRILVYPLITVLLFSLLSPVYAEVHFSVNTNQSTYYHNETINIIGTGGSPAGIYMLEISDAGGFPIWAMQGDYSLSGQLNYTILVGRDWDYGVYTIQIKDIESDRVAETNFLITYTPGVPLSITFPLKEGWNLISFPVNFTDNSVSIVLDDLAFFQIYEWTPSGYNQTEYIIPGKGYWIMVMEDTDFTVTGDPITQVILNLNVGWDLCGGPITKEDSVPSFNGFYQMVGWSNNAYQPKTQFIPKNGYWVLVLQPELVSIPPQA